jgi:hypothetical protein
LYNIYLDTTPQKLANYLLVLAKTIIDKPDLARKSTHRHAPDYQRMFRMKLRYRMYTKKHYSLRANVTDIFTRYWLHRNILGNIRNGKIRLNEQI